MRPGKVCVPRVVEMGSLFVSSSSGGEEEKSIDYLSLENSQFLGTHHLHYRENSAALHQHGGGGV